MVNYLCAKVSIFEPCLIKSNFPSDGMGGSIERLNMMHSCLSAAKEVLDYIFAQPLSYHFTYSVIDVTIMGYACGILTKLSLLVEVGWDLKKVQQTTPFNDYFGRVRHNMEQVGKAIDRSQGDNCIPSFFSMAASKMRLLESWHEQKLASLAEPEALFSPDLNSLTNLDNIDFLDDQFWYGLISEGTAV